MRDKTPDTLESLVREMVERFAGSSIYHYNDHGYCVFCGNDDRAPHAADCIYERARKLVTP